MRNTHKTSLNVCLNQFNSNIENVGITGIHNSEDEDIFVFYVEKPRGFGSYMCFIDIKEKTHLLKNGISEFEGLYRFKIYPNEHEY